MSNRNIRKAIRSLWLRVREHEDKIANEMAKPQPDTAVIAHWEREIQTWQRRIQRLEDRLARRVRRGGRRSKP
jgi:predicted  nucleic acid-binding Zn-ribbon protein